MESYNKNLNCKLACLLFPFVYSLTVNAQSEQYNFDPALFDKVVITHASGKINVNNSEKAELAHLNTHEVVSKDECETTYEVKDRTLYLTTEKKIFAIKSECAQDINFSVPLDKDVKVSLGVGQINFAGYFPSIEADLGSGNINVRGKVANLDLDVAAGSVTVSGLDGYGKIMLLSGNLDVKYDQPKNKLNQLFVSKSVGNTKISVPKGVKAESNLKTRMGKVSNTVIPSDKGEFYFSVKTNVGDIRMDTY